jgi:glycosyltransferase involved in cell wall biosynthesis
LSVPSRTPALAAAADVTVVIPTIADAKRGETIWRTIESAGSRCGANTRVVVVVNGTRFDPRLLEALRNAPNSECLYLEQGSLPLALKAGREAVRSEFFAFIDDDDEFLENGLGRRLELLRGNPQAAFLISQGWFHTNGIDVPQTDLDAKTILADPLGSMLRQNWVATSASGLYRTSKVVPEDFAQMPSYLEWTYLGFRLASRHNFVFTDEPTYRRYDMIGSESKSPSFRRGMVKALRAILAQELPQDARAGLCHKLAGAHHDLSVLALEEGKRAEATRQHLMSLFLPGGLRYLSYTRHLLGPRPRATH